VHRRWTSARSASSGTDAALARWIMVACSIGARALIDAECHVLRQGPVRPGDLRAFPVAGDVVGRLRRPHAGQLPALLLTNDSRRLGQLGS
jgi:hypothetical protein